MAPMFNFTGRVGYTDEQHGPSARMPFFDTRVNGPWREHGPWTRVFVYGAFTWRKGDNGRKVREGEKWKEEVGGGREGRYWKGDSSTQHVVINSKSA